MTETNTLYQRPAELLQNLIRFDTTNPPGNEAACIGYVADLLRTAGVNPLVLERTPGRANLVARLKGRGEAPPLLLYGHVDVVTTANQNWTHPPFEGRLVDGYIWGRGALDMKGGVAMMTPAFLRALAEGLQPAGDVILALVSDEEAGGEDGALFLVDQHADLFQGVRYALGEFGGFTLYIGGKRFYPVMVAEKQICWMKATVRGQGGHASAPVRGQAMARLAHLLTALDRHLLPVHITPVVSQMIGGLAEGVGGVTGQVLRALLNPALANSLLRVLGERGQIFSPVLRNTVSPTIVRSSQKINVIPSEVSLELDGRLLPGYKPDDMLAELRRIIGPDVEVEILRHDPGPAEPNMGMFETLAGILRQADPHGIVVPLLLSGVTDARFFSRLGIQTYGFLPMMLQEDFNFIRTIHTADERIPAEAVAFGAEAIYQAVQRFGA